MSDDRPLFRPAALEWPERWNGTTGPVAGIDRFGDQVILTTCIGFVKFSASRDGAEVLRQLQTACDLLREELA